MTPPNYPNRVLYTPKPTKSYFASNVTSTSAHPTEKVTHPSAARSRLTSFLLCCYGFPLPVTLILSPPPSSSSSPNPPHIVDLLLLLSLLGHRHGRGRTGRCLHGLAMGGPPNPYWDSAAMGAVWRSQDFKIGYSYFREKNVQLKSTNGSMINRIIVNVLKY